MRHYNRATVTTRFSPADIARRRAALPPITYPEELPVSGKRAEIAEAIRARLN